MSRMGDEGDQRVKMFCLLAVQLTDELDTMSSAWLWLHLEDLVNKEIERVFGAYRYGVVNTTTEQAIYTAWDIQTAGIASGYQMGHSIVPHLAEFINSETIATTLTDTYLDTVYGCSLVFIYRDAILRWYIGSFFEHLPQHSKLCNIMVKVMVRATLLHEYRHCCQSKRLLRFHKIDQSELDAEIYARQAIYSQIFLEQDW